MSYEMTKDMLSTDWGTPWKDFEPLNREFGFERDVCARKWNTKVFGSYYNLLERGEDGLRLPWAERNWCNPPYGAKNIEQWLAKGLAEQRDGKLTVFLLPDTLDVKWVGMIYDTAQKRWKPGIEMRPIIGRINFETPPELGSRHGNVGGNILVVMYPVDKPQVWPGGICPTCGTKLEEAVK